MADYKTARWHPIYRMPATVLEILQEDDVYFDLNFGTNFLNVPQDYTSRTGGIARHSKRPLASGYTLDFPGINYRTEIWLNRERIAGPNEVNDSWNTALFVDGHASYLNFFFDPDQPGHF